MAEYLHKGEPALNKDVTYYRLTSSQKSILIIEQFYPQNQFVILATTIKIQGKVDYRLLNEAINTVLEQNDTFHLRMADEYHDVKQYFVPYIPKDLPFKDFSYPSGEKDFRIWAEQTSKQPFTLYDAELFYIALVKLSDAEGGFYLKCHHLIADGWSIVLFVNRVIEIYKALLQGEAPAGATTSVGRKRAPLGLSYVNRITSEEKYLASERFLKDKNYWQKALSHVYDSMLFDKGTRSGLKARRLTGRLPDTLVAELKQFCTEKRISPFIVFCAVLAVFFARTREKETIVIGATVLNRMSLKDKSTMGAFFNELPFVIDVRPDLPFREYLNILRLQWIELLRHSSYPYVELLKEYRETHKVKNRLFDVTLNFINASYSELNSQEIRLTSERYFVGQEVSSLCVAIDDLEGLGRLNLYYDYADDLIAEEEIHILHNSLTNLLTEALAKPELPLKSLPLLSDSEQKKITEEFNAPRFAYVPEESIIGMFCRQAAQTPSATALLFDGQELSYRELDEKSNRLANYLKDKGVRKEEIIGLMVARSFDLVIGILGILKAGAAYLPLDPAYPQGRINYMIADSRCRFLVTNLELVKEDYHCEIIDLTGEGIDKAGKDLPVPLPAKNDLAYVIYTSGSTGVPKGVMIEHQAVCHFVQAVSEEIELRGKTIASLTTFSFDIFFLETILPVLLGMKVVIAGPQEKGDPAVLPELIRKYGVNVIQATPSKIGVIANNPSCLARLTDILVGGEPLMETLLQKIKRASKAKIYNMYGPTEATIWSSVKRMDQSDRITIGRPLSNTKYYILDKHLMPMPIGIAGEIYIGGESLARGYLGRPELTAQRFIPNPFIPGQRIYKTGDLGKWLENGEIEFLGRNDCQVKIHGFRIETGEIEECLLRDSRIKQAVVLSKIDRNNKNYLCAYIEGREELSAQDVRRHLKAFLPEYMIPSRFIFLEKLPLTPNGKIDRSALPNIVETETEATCVSPRNQTEKNLVEVWEKVLDKAGLGIDNNFFELGGDSLDILEMLTALLPFGWRLSAQDVYEYPTVRELARLIARERPSTPLVKEGTMPYPSKVRVAVRDDDRPFLQGDILLTGSTGFLGIHVLHELLEKVSGKIYCLVRGADYQEKFQRRVRFYFSDIPLSQVLKKAVVIRGDITQKRLGLNDEAYETLRRDVKTVIHCASLVKHYGDYAEFEKVNVRGTANVIDFCSAGRMNLAYVSTTSVSGNFMLEGCPAPTFGEEDFFIGQDFSSNVYVRSKFEAEALLQTAMASGLNVLIFRVGLLTGRYEDGKFQYNIAENAYYRKLKSVFALGCLPEKALEESLEFTPVDSCAQAMMAILTAEESKQTVYHLFNHKMIRIADFLAIIRNYGLEVKGIPQEEFMDTVTSHLATAQGQEIVSGIVADLMYSGLSFSPIVEVRSQSTLDFLEKHGFEWPYISAEYILKILIYMKNVGFLENLPEKKGLLNFIANKLGQPFC